jgi:2-polyprenyl-6-methoxyphenol hydroxylase-like FAD-dependent oxidoreductase
MTSVLVVGAGPTGLTLACELLRRGVSVRVIDQLEAPSPLSKAVVIHARTLEVLEPLGATETLVARGLHLGGVTMHASGKPIVSASLDELDTRYPYLLSIAQADTEALLTACLERLGGRVERGLQLTALAQDADGVSATLRRADGTEERETAHWLVGCDGAHSNVRKQLGLDFEGRGYADQFVLADVKLDGDLPRDRISTFFHAEGIAAFFPMPDDRWRIIGNAAAKDDGPPGMAQEAPPLAELQALVDRRTERKLVLLGDVWRARFRIHCRQVDRYRVGRAFLCGDAAHIHSPVGGQGMNTGIQDAHNLSWKLALAERGKASPALLESYHAERHGIGADVLRATDVATRVAMLRQPIARAIRDHLGGYLASLEVVQERVARAAAELDLSYKRSPIVSDANITPWRAFGGGPQAGTRAPDGFVGGERLLARLGDRAHTVLLFDGRAAGSYDKLTHIARGVRARHAGDVQVKLVVPAASAPPGLDPDDVILDAEGDLEARYGAHSECAFVIRPDLYIGFRSQPADEARLLVHLGAVLG